MNRIPLLLLLAACCFPVRAEEPATPFWDRFPRIVESTQLEDALDLRATIGMNASQTDPGWGLFGQRIGSKPGRTERFREAGLKSISYFETFGQAYCYIAERGPRRDDLTTLKAGHWSWQRYGGGPIVWVGPQNYFDDEEFARPYTRTHPRYGAPPATGPDGTEATGYEGSIEDPRNSRILDAVCAKDILGRLSYESRYNEHVNKIDPETGEAAGPLDGTLLIPKTGKRASIFLFKKDSACPAWIDYTRASTLMAADTGIDGMWTDNFGPWDSFGHRPVEMAFGEWSVARFRDFLSASFSAEQLETIGVGDPTTFDIREKMMEIAREWGWDGENLKSPVWSDPRWRDQPLWRAYLIYKRQVGTEALTRYYETVKEAAREAGKNEFLIAGNDVPGFSLGWPRGDLDMVSSELAAGWGLARGPRGFLLPPYGRFAPIYKVSREHARSRFVNIWLYRDHFEEELRLPGMVSTMYYEMLANHTLPMFHPGHPRVAGTPETNRDFFEFVARVAPEYGDRVPIEEVGVYYNSSSMLSRITPGGMMTLDRQPHQFCFWGWCTALGELHYQYRAIPEWKLDRETLLGIRVLVLPEAEILDPEAVEEILIPWVRDEGGLLVVTGNTGERGGESKNFKINPDGFATAPLTGVERIESATDERVRDIGEKGGKVLYLPGNDGLDFYLAEDEARRETLLPEFARAIDSLFADAAPPVVDVVERMSSRVGVTLYRSPTSKNLFVDLNHFGVDGISDEIGGAEPITISVHRPESLVGKNLVARALAPEATPEVTVRATAPDRIEVSVGAWRGYAGIIVAGD